MSTLVGKQASVSQELTLALPGLTLSVPATPQRGIQAFLKRQLDIILSLLALVLLSPLFLLVVMAIVIETGGPVFFRQKRLGLCGREFTVYKFRSMVKDAERLLPLLIQNNEIDDGPIFKWRKDPRITRVGRVLRRTSLDELPQLFNVLIGNMSLVGPRPPLESEVAKYKEHHIRRLSAKPGMTGLWQVSGRSNLSFSEMVRLDLHYIDTWSFWADLAILARTPLAVIIARGAF